MKHKLITFSCVFFAAILFQSCASTARISDFPRNASGYDFTKIASAKKTKEDKSWNKKTGFEYYLKTDVDDEAQLIQAINGALRKEQFVIKFSDHANGAVIAERDLRANEWKSVAGVYFQKASEGFEVYVNCKITQDFTGGWREDRAGKIGEAICGLLKTCVQSYPVNTSLAN